jgi:2-dehydro-3-deoxygluconokinase
MIEMAPAPEAPGLFRLGAAGDTFNTAVYMARLAGGGAHRAWYVTAIGEDGLSDRLIDAFQAEGLRTDLVFRLPGLRPGVYLIENDPDGERRFHYWRHDSAARRLLDEGREGTLARALAGFDLVFVSGISLAILAPPARERLLRLLAGLGPDTRLGFDPNYRPVLWAEPEAARAACARMAALGPIVLSSFEDERALFGDAAPASAAARWLAAGAREAVIRHGAAPCLLAACGETLEVPARSGVPARDTTGAGDAFNAGYLWHRLRGAAPRDAAAEGHDLAAEVIQVPGAILPRPARNG